MTRHTPARSPARTTCFAGSRGGYTLIEVFVVLAMWVILMGILLPASGRSRATCINMKDSTQVRGILQGLVIWAQNDQDRYPLPSRVDGSGATVGAKGAAKNTTSNILSMLIYNGFVPTEMFVSPQEANGAIEEYRDYEFDEPSLAVDPDHAMWDPAFHGSPVSEFNIDSPWNPADVGNNSYAHALPAGRRLALWESTFVGTEAAFGNRGPKVTQATHDGCEYDGTSITNLIHGGRESWEGNVGYSDNHVNFETRIDPEGLTYLAKDGQRYRDVIFHNETDDARGDNAFLSVWVATGDSLEDCVSWID